MTPVPFFLVPAALGSGLVIGMFVGIIVAWIRTRETRRRLSDARIVYSGFAIDSAFMDLGPRELKFINDMNRALYEKYIVPKKKPAFRGIRRGRIRHTSPENDHRNDF